MKINLTVLTLVIGLLAGCATSLPQQPAGVTVHESVDLAEAREQALALAARYGRDRVLVAFDLDNTLLAMKTELGADQWYDWQRALQQASPCDPHLVSDRLAVQGALYHLGAMRPTQPDVGRIVASLRSEQVPTLVLTARGRDFWLSTFRELRRNGLDFEAMAPGPPGGFPEPYIPEGASREVIYQDGVYMLAGQHKGRMLLELLDRVSDRRPAAVVFVDDKAKNIAAVREALSEAGVHGELYFYRREEPRVSDFDEQRAAADWQRIAAAVQLIQRVMGTDNFDVPEPHTLESCR